jgi:hypothetical protein
VAATLADGESSTYHEGKRSWLADQLIEPTKLIFAIVIAESLNDYKNVLTSPFHGGRYIAAIALLGVYMTTVWSWFGWHTAHVRYPYKTQDGRIATTWETWRFYADIAIVIAYAYALFQVDPIVSAPRADLIWLLVAYPAIIALYFFETTLRQRSYGADVRRLVPLLITFVLYCGVILGYALARRALEPAAAKATNILALNGITLGACIVVMWFYRFRLNEWWKRRITQPAV